MNRIQGTVGAVFVAGFVLSGSPRILVSQETVTAIADHFEVGGLSELARTSPDFSCTSHSLVLEELFSRQLSDERVGELAVYLGHAGSQDCPNSNVDEWLVSRLLEAYSRPERPEPHCSIDCMEPYITLERRLLDALSQRTPPNAFEIWMRVAEGAPTIQTEADAVRIAARSLSEDDRIEVFLEGAKAPELLPYVHSEALSLPSLFVRRYSGRQIAEVPSTQAIRILVDGIGGIALGRPNASREFPDSALVWLEQALEVVEPGEFRDRIERMVQSARFERMIQRMDASERVNFLLTSMAAPDSLPRHVANLETGRLAREYAAEFLAGLSVEALISLADDSNASILIGAVGDLAAGRLSAGNLEVDSAIRLLEAAAVAAPPGRRREMLRSQLPPDRR